MSDHPELEAQSIDQQALADEWAAALSGDNDPGAPADDCQPAPLPPLTGAPVATGEMNLDVILDIPVTLSIELGRTRVPIRNLLQLNQGSVVELDRIAGEPLDVLVNGTLIAQGEAVVVNEKFGIRLTDVVSPSERVRRLK